jgi:predicted phosphoribosyltransferase
MGWKQVGQTWFKATDKLGAGLATLLVDPILFPGSGAFFSSLNTAVQQNFNPLRRYVFSDTNNQTSNRINSKRRQIRSKRRIRRRNHRRGRSNLRVKTFT